MRYGSWVCGLPLSASLLEHLLASLPLTCVTSVSAWLDIVSDSAMMEDQRIPLGVRAATVWKSVNLSPLLIQIQNHKKTTTKKKNLLILCHSL